MSRVPEDVADIEQAKRNAATARARVQTSVGALKQRLSPGNLASQAKDKVRETTSAIGDKATGAVQKRPIAASAVGGALVLILFRRPIGKLGKLLFRRDRKSSERNREPDPRKSEATIRAGDPPRPSITPRIERAVTQANAAALKKE